MVLAAASVVCVRCSSHRLHFKWLFDYNLKKCLLLVYNHKLNNSHANDYQWLSDDYNPANVYAVTIWLFDYLANKCKAIPISAAAHCSTFHPVCSMVMYYPVSSRALWKWQFSNWGGREGIGLGGVVAATIADNFFSMAKWLCCKRCCTRLNLNDYLTIWL